MKFKNIRQFTLAAALVAMLAGCDRPFEYDRPLAVSSRQVNLKAAAGSTHVMVYSNCGWTARLTEPVKWASLNKLSGEGISDVIFTYSANYAVAREVGIIFQTSEMTDTVMMTQAGSITEASFLLDNSSVTLLRSSADVSLPVSTNLRYGIESIRTSVKYSEEMVDEEAGETVPEDIDRWIGDVTVTRTAVHFSVVENKTGEPRVAYINFNVFDPSAPSGSAAKATLVVTQTAADPVLSFVQNEMQVRGNEGEYLCETIKNNIWPYADYLEYSCDAEWISGLKLTSDGLAFSVAQNEDDVTRRADIGISYTDELGNLAQAKLTVVQVAYPREISFADVRALAPGAIGQYKYLEGYIVSDYNSPNIISSVQTGQFRFDRSGIPLTAYFESMDGSYGFRLKFATQEDAAIKRYSRIRLNVSGLTLVKETNPDRYGLEGVVAENIVDVQECDMSRLPLKNKKISELADDDIYTMVNIRDMEIMCKDGAYTNCTDGYSLKEAANPQSGTTTAPRWDVAPLLCCDMEGNGIYMLTNAACTWRRGETDLGFNKLLPQGSGTFNGVVVAEEQVTVRYGDCGRYQLRYMEPSDLAFSNPAFSKTIVEWNWNSRVAAKLTPDEGEGSLNIHSATAAAASDFNNTYNGRSTPTGNGGATSNQKGLVVNAGLKLTNKWWDFTEDVGRYFDIEFSTAGISGSNMTFGLVWNHGAMSNSTLDSPAHWKLLYSVDGGASFKDVPDCEIIKNRSIVWWSTTSQDSCPGFKDHIRKLPSDCFGKEKVVVRVQVADKVTDKNPSPSTVSDDRYLNFLGIEKATLTDKATEIRIGTITVRYN